MEVIITIDYLQYHVFSSKSRKNVSFNKFLLSVRYLGKEKRVRQHQSQCNINVGSISNLQKKEAKILAYAYNNNNKRNSTHSTLGMCHEIGLNSKSDHFWSHPSFKWSSTINDLLAIEIYNYHTIQKFQFWVYIQK